MGFRSPLENNPHAVSMQVYATCGHVVKFLIDPEHFGTPQRIARFRDRKCSACRQAEGLQLQLAAQVAKANRGGRVKKGQEINHLPPGAMFALRRRDDGGWDGQLTVSGEPFAAEGNGLMGIISKLARQWLRSKQPVQAPE